MDIRKRALELLGMSGISEEDRMKQSLDEANQHQETVGNPESTSFFDKLRNLYNPEEEVKPGPGVRLNQNKVKKFKRE